MSDKNTLKAYFITNAIPTQSQFADLIDSMLIQDAGISKQPGDPLSITAEGDATGVQPVINFYDIAQIDQPNPSWSLQLNPVYPSDNKNKPGFCIADGAGNQRLLINNLTNNNNQNVSAVSIYGIVNILDTGAFDTNKNMAAGSLTIGSNSNSYGSGNGNTAGLLLTTAANTEIAVNEYDQRIASLIYYQGNKINKITIGRDIGYNATPVTIASNLNVANNLSVMGLAQVFDDNGFKAEMWMQSGSLTIGNSTKSYGGGTSVNNFAGGNLAGLVLVTQEQTEIAVNDCGNQEIFSLLYYDSKNITIGRDMGCGSTPVTIASDLEVKGNSKVNGNIIASCGFFDAYLNTYINFSIELVGTANQTGGTGNNNSLTVNGISVTQMQNQSGLNTVILNIDGSFKKYNNNYHSNGSDSNFWDDWALWVITNAEYGDIVAVTSYAAIGQNASGENVDKLLYSIQATIPFTINNTSDLTPYALIFVMGRTSIEVGNVPIGQNANISTNLQTLVNSSPKWITADLQNNWGKLGTNFYDVQFCKDKNEFIWFRGGYIVNNNTIDCTQGSTIFTLPNGFIPAKNINLHVLVKQADKTTIITTGQLEINRVGNVILYSLESFDTNTFFSLDGIVFSLSP